MMHGTYNVKLAMLIQQASRQEVTFYLSDKITIPYIMEHETEKSLRLNAVSDFR